MPGDFLIDLPYHKRWMLPDGVHYYNAVMYGDRVHITIWNNCTGELTLSLPDIMLDPHEKYVELSELSQALAEKKFRKPQSKAKEYARTGFMRIR
jgi:hypothetical protein